jgi:predicted nucleotidyltransferase component of viral defense system
MSKGTITNMQASVLTRLKSLSKLRRQDYQHILLRYATERFLYRLSVSGYADNFVLKGGNLFVIWQNGDNSRPTMDSDLLCFGDTSHEHLWKVFASIAGLEDSDGIMFDADGIAVEAIREDTKYSGTRITFNAFIGTVRIPLQFDIGVGDAITPAPEQADFPVLLDGSSPHLKIYPMATVIAEKLEAMVVRGGSNSRMKDFYDIWQLSRLAEHSARTLRTAIENTFQRRGTEFPRELPYALTVEFAHRPEKPVQWHAFCRKNHLSDAPLDFGEIVMSIAAFLGPCLKYEHDRNMLWSPDNGWKNADE